ncbi:DUF6969 family protein [Dichotomicrobium thermohalophilum]|uniref:DUF6969 domain-containing protein n=1 Tax=Dichotomicrobium thermohalophilum TaxID=933063 RepID=A0A397QBK2_9HYPH|nr:hypothetical protein [Dichotomicrobium thermohalophilum]RIA56867.1 hypothetical protein BXY53_1980 [Dichotomicrobium thermohalophilum]
MRHNQAAASDTATDNPSPTPSQGQHRAAMDLVACLQSFAVQNTNAVLAILGDTPFVANKHYPEGDLVFGGGLWRAYYHAHDMPGAPDSRMHGHFHVFARPDANFGYAHVIGLAVDGNGQPLKWFTTNHWVTGEAWRPGEELAACVPPVEPEDAPPAARWLSAMLRFGAPAFPELLAERDATLAAHRARTEQSEEEARADRTLYLLSQREIDLMEELRAALALEGD